ncbi:hypothetical protein UlMin_030673 [Ulmus minor]
MALSHLLFSLFLSSLVFISSANNYVPRDNFQNQFHDHPTENDNFLPTDFVGHPFPNGNKPNNDPNTYHDGNVYAGTIPTNVFAIKGVVLCNSGSKYFPLHGAIVKITCPTEDYNGYKSLSTISCHKTNENGLFYETLSLWKLKVKYLNVEGCKTYLEYSPLESCKFPTDVNNGITGDLLSSTQILQDKSLLYSVGPFIYISKPYDHSNIPNDYAVPNPDDVPVPTPNDDVPVPSENTTPNGY